MAGYKRVNFYELCRLCATNQQKEKTHIFEEEGRKIQLQNKIQSCLSLKVCENDFLPKVVCGQCLETLEECYTFRNECVNSESMLSSYFNNFRYTEDFKKSGKVYIKDTSSCKPPTNVIQDPLYIPPATSVANTSQTNVPNSSASLPKQTESLYYTIQQVAPPEKIIGRLERGHTKVIQNPTVQVPSGYNINVNQISCPTIKTVTSKQDNINTVNNITVNANGEIINLASISDIEALVAQNVVQKMKQVNVNTKQVIQHPKRQKPEKPPENMEIDNILQIDLTAPEPGTTIYEAHPIKLEKLPHIKTTADSKFMYAIKLDDSKGSIPQAGIVLNQLNQLTGHQSFGTVQTSMAATTSINANITPSNVNIIPSFASVPLMSTGIVQQKIKVSNQKITETVQQNVNNSSNSINNNSYMQDIKNNIMMVAQNQSRISTSNIVANPTINVPNSNGAAIPSGYVTVSYNNNTNSNNNNSNNTSSTNNNNCIVTSSTCTNSVAVTSVVTNNVNNSISNNSSNGSTSQLISATSDNSNQNSLTSTNNSASTTSINVISMPQSNSKIYTCDICQKVFKRREHLNQHINLHTGHRPFVCVHCNKSFMRKEHLLRHMTSHSGQKNYTCSICEKSFSRNDNLLKHKKTHDKQGRYTCEYCPKTFVMKHYYLAHKMHHETNEQPKYAWNVLKV